MCGGAALPTLSKRSWPATWPVRDVLSYLEQAHKAAGQPYMVEIGRAVALVPTTLSAFFTGVRLIGRAIVSWS
jgi:hypothetical protein